MLVAEPVGRVAAQQVVEHVVALLVRSLQRDARLFEQIVPDGCPVQAPAGELAAQSRRRAHGDAGWGRSEGAVVVGGWGVEQSEVKLSKVKCWKGQRHTATFSPFPPPPSHR